MLSCVMMRACCTHHTQQHSFISFYPTLSISVILYFLCIKPNVPYRHTIIYYSYGRSFYFINGSHSNPVVVDALHQHKTHSSFVVLLEINF